MPRLHYAARSGDLATVRQELDRGVPVDTDAGGDFDDGGTPLMWAALSRHAGEDMLRLLLDRGANPNAVAGDLSRTALRDAARSGSLSKVVTLLNAGADPTYCDPNGYTVLVSAAPSSEPETPEIVKALVAAGAPLDMSSRWGESPLSVASRVANFKVVRLLLDAGADPAPLEWSPLMRAAAVGSVDELTAELRRAGSPPIRDR